MQRVCRRAHTHKRLDLLDEQLISIYIFPLTFFSILFSCGPTKRPLINLGNLRPCFFLVFALLLCQIVLSDRWRDFERTFKLVYCSKVMSMFQEFCQ